MSIRKILNSITENFNLVVKSLTINQRVIFTLALSGIIVGTFGVVYSLSQEVSDLKALNGGEIKEGLVGYPRFINPILASSSTDKTLSNIIYSSLVKEGNKGEIIFDVAESVQVSEDKTNYTVKIKEDVFFHDKKQLTTKDIFFTISLIQDSKTKSPLASRFAGVEMEIINDFEITFKLARPYNFFLKSLTIGIVPEHLWSELRPEQISFSEYNLRPIGSGPMKIDKLKMGKSGFPIAYKLKRHTKYHLDGPYLTGYNFYFFDNPSSSLKALDRGKIDVLAGFYEESFINTEINKEYIVNVPRYFGLFINNEKTDIAISDTNIRRAVNLWIDREKIIKKVLDGYGKEISKGVPDNFLSSKLENLPTAGIGQERKNQAIKLLELSGYKINPENNFLEKENKILTLNLVSGDSEELKNASQEIKMQLEELGIRLNVTYYSSSNLEQNIIPNRNYEILLFGQVLQTETDLYAFWHSTQRLNPGINITNYKNEKVDEWLENTLTETDDVLRRELFDKIVLQLENDLPIIFLYSPNYIIKSHKNINGLNIEMISEPEKRFFNLNNWYLYQDEVWKIFN